VKGKKLQAALYLPANYEPGKKYPTIVYIYEHLSDGFNRFVQPTANGFNKSVYTSNGYAVLMPDITYTINDPGMSAVWCVLPALKAAIATGIVDPARVGLHGHSWGGYQTSFRVTQTNAFKAAIAGAPLTNMVSMYSIVYKNTGGGNMALFESGQGRFRGGYWRKPWPGEAGEPLRLHGAHEGILRPSPEGRARAGLVDRGRAASRHGEAPERARAQAEESPAPAPTPTTTTAASAASMP
jgi:hypothetical protein